MSPDAEPGLESEPEPVVPRLNLVPNVFGEAAGAGALPKGTVTLLLADVEGSTRLWENRPEEMANALETMDRVVVELVCLHGGVRPVEQGEGDSFVVAFTRASDAVACALALQQAALAPINLRIGLHTGEIQLRDEGNYMGPTINRAARVRDLAHGGQTLLSGTTADLVRDALPPQASLIDFGHRVLRDLSRPERVVQLCHPDLHNDFPPLRTREVVEFRWRPAQLTPFVGRVSELAHVGQLLDVSRLLTISGPGGVGKTRIAIEAASRSGTRFADGVRYVDLSAVTDPELAAFAVARAMELAEPPDRCITVDALIRHLGDRRLLLVVDNCEHLLDACAALVGVMLGACPNLTVLATSRSPLGTCGEQVFPVPGMSATDDAVQLFAEHARRGSPGFAPGPSDIAAVEEICRRLDGLPLAIELAAARVRSCSLAEIIDSLDARLDFLTGGPRTATRRHRTLKACVDWSYGLLTEPEKDMFRRISVLPGAFDQQGARQMAAEGTPSFQTVDMLAALVEKSLLAAETLHGRTQYRLSETMREYASEQMRESG
jgi:predicted ATPase/class 3 adenylate cyclase